MFSYAVRRLLGAIPTLFVVITLTFFMMRAAPGGPFDSQRNLPPEIKHNIEAAYNLDKPLIVQYGLYLKRLAHFDLGPSFKNRDFTVTELIAQTRTAAAKAVENQADFALRGLSEEYLGSGTALVEAFEAAFAPTNEALSHRGAAVGSKKSAYSEADEHFDELDIYIRNHYADRPDKLNAWRNATHIERSAAKKDGNEGVKNKE